MKNINLKPNVQDAMVIIGKTFKVLDDRERRILLLHYGMETGNSHSMAEIARMDKVSRERIRQIVTKALSKIELVLMYEE